MVLFVIKLELHFMPCKVLFKVYYCTIFFCPQDEMNLSGYRKYLISQAAPLPLTAAEEELRRIKLNEVNVHIHMQTHKSELCTSQCLFIQILMPVVQL